MPRSSAERPLAFTIDYVRDDVDKKAHWAVASKQAPLPDNWSSFGPWQRGVLPYSGRTRWLAKAPLIEIPAASVAKVGEMRRGDHRLVRLRLSSGGANTIALRFDKGVPILAMGLPGAMRRIDKDADVEPSFLRCSGRACDNLLVDVEIGTAKPVEAKLIAARFGLPPEGAKLEAIRPANSHPQYGPDSAIRIGKISL